MKSIRSALTTFLAASLVATGVTLMAISVHIAGRSVDQGSLANMRTLVENVANYADLKLESDLIAMKMLAEQPSLKAHVPVEEKAPIVANYVDSFDSYARYFLVCDPTGHSLTTDNIVREVPARAYFQEAIKGNATISGPLISARARRSMTAVFGCVPSGSVAVPNENESPFFSATEKLCGIERSSASIPRRPATSALSVPCPRPVSANEP